jgi:uncharacterized protein (TIGR02996 family)
MHNSSLTLRVSVFQAEPPMNEQGFLDAIATSPNDEDLWRIYADWLEDQGDPRSKFLRLAVALAEEEGPAQARAVADQLAAIRGALNPDWIVQVVRLRAGRPLRIRITEIYRLGNGPPREMLVRNMTVVTGILQSGTIRVGDRVAFPLASGGVEVTTVLHLETFNTSHSELSAGQLPLAEFGMVWRGHQLADLGIQKDGLILPAE